MSPDTPIRITRTVLVVDASPEVLAAVRIHQAAREVAQRAADAYLVQWARDLEAETCS